MKKDKFMTSILILLIGGGLTKILGFIIKILFTRTIGPVGLSYYTIVMPTYSLLITFATFSLPISISKLVSEGKTKSKKIIFSSAFFLILFHLILVTTTIILAPFIAKYLLHQEILTPLIIAMATTLPFISISSLLKGYFLGKLKVSPNTVSNVFEQLLRIIFLLFFFPKIVQKGTIIAAMSFILLNIASELLSTFIFCLYLPKKIMITKQDLKIDSHILRRMLGISIPSVSGRLIGNIGFFLEPILLTNILLFIGYSHQYILKEYAAYNAYAIGLLTIPSFFIQAICQILIPEISKYHADNNRIMVNRRLKQALSYSLIIGICCSSIIFLFRDNLLFLLYKTTNGSNYIFLLAPFFPLFYLEAPLSSALQAVDHSKDSMKISLYGTILKLISITILSFGQIGIYSLVISEIINIFFVTLLNKKYLKKALL